MMRTYERVVAVDWDIWTMVQPPARECAVSKWIHVTRHMHPPPTRTFIVCIYKQSSSTFTIHFHFSSPPRLLLEQAYNLYSQNQCTKYMLHVPTYPHALSTLLTAQTWAIVYVFTRIMLMYVWLLRGPWPLRDYNTFLYHSQFDETNMKETWTWLEQVFFLT